MTHLNPPLLLALCDNLDLILRGHSAGERLSASGRSGQGALVVLPSWVWLTPLINVGRKGRDGRGKPTTLPTRLVWNSGSVVIVEANKSIELDWRLVGLGHDRRGTSTLTVTGTTGVLDYPRPPGISIVNAAIVHDSKSLRSKLDSIIRAGTAARWDIIVSLESLVRSSLLRANRTVAAEIGSYRAVHLLGVLDELSLDDLATRMLFGDGGSSTISRMIDRSLRPTQFAGVDPLRYFAVAIRARAEELVRARIGDPKVGPKVRRIHAISGATTIDELVDVYRQRYPRDALAAKRAVAALTAGPEISAGLRDTRADGAD